MVKSGGRDEPVLGFFSVLAFEHHTTSKVMNSVKALLGRKFCASDQDRASLQTILSSACGLLIAERLVNTPSELLGSMHTSLLDDIRWAVDHAEPASSRPGFKFKHLVTFVETGDMPPAPAQMPPVRGPAHQGRAGKKRKCSPLPCAALRPGDDVLMSVAEAGHELGLDVEPRRKNQPPSRLRALVLTLDNYARVPGLLAQAEAGGGDEDS